MSRRRDRRRKLHAHEVARRDQLMAGAREAAKEPGQAVVVVDYAAPAVQCSWCDCPDTPGSPHYTDPAYVCAGCPGAAAYVVQPFYGTPEAWGIPTCAAHYLNVARTVQRWLGNPHVEHGGTWEDPS